MSALYLLKKRAKLEGRGASGKTAVVGLKDRASNRVAARVVPDTRSETVSRFIMEHVEPGARLYTDDSPVYASMPNHESVKHSAMEYVRGPVHTNGYESFWSMLKRAHTGTFHKISTEHLPRYVNEFAGRHNMRRMDTLDQMAHIIDRMNGKRLRYKDLIS